MRTAQYTSTIWGYIGDESDHGGGSIPSGSWVLSHLHLQTGQSWSHRLDFLPTIFPEPSSPLLEWWKGQGNSRTAVLIIFIPQWNPGKRWKQVGDGHGLLFFYLAILVIRLLELKCWGSRLYCLLSLVSHSLSSFPQPSGRVFKETLAGGGVPGSLCLQRNVMWQL